MSLEDCFNTSFFDWVIDSNYPKSIKYWDKITHSFNKMSQITQKELEDDIVKGSLEEIYDVLKREPLADYFWYTHDGKLTWTTPDSKLAPGDSLRINKEKIKAFLREEKLNELLK